MRLLSLTGAVVAVSGIVRGSAIELSKNFGVSCSPITYDAKAKLPATIELYIKSVELEDESKMKDFLFPVLIFRATDIYNFLNIPDISNYDREYYTNWTGLREAVVDSSGDKFDLERRSGYPEVDTSRVLNTYVALDTEENQDKPEHIDVIFPVTKSGVYCVYIAPPSTGVAHLSVPIRYQNSYGLLNLSQYAVYSLYKYLILLGVILFAYLFSYIIRMVGRDFLALNSLSVISKLTVFYLVPPMVLCQTIDWIFLGVKNRHIASSVHNALYEFFEAVFDIVEDIFAVYFSAIFLLFGMGYGVIYYHRGSRKYRELPQSMLRFVSILFAVNVVVVVLRTCMGDNIINSPIFDPALVLLFPQMIEFKRRGWLMSIIDALVKTASVIIPAVWSIATIYYYFQTKKLIAKFPPVQSGNTDANEKIARSFRQSVYVIIGLPILVVVSGLFFFGVETGLRNPQLYAKKYANEEQRALAMFEDMVMGNLLLTATFWLNILAYYLTVVFIYFIWIRGNNGLLADDGAFQEYDDVAQYEVYSDDDLSPVSTGATNSAPLETLDQDPEIENVSGTPK